VDDGEQLAGDVDDGPQLVGDCHRNAAGIP